MMIPKPIASIGTVTLQLATAIELRGGGESGGLMPSPHSVERHVDAVTMAAFIREDRKALLARVRQLAAAAFDQDPAVRETAFNQALRALEQEALRDWDTP